jgi:hypothetical protein
MLKIKIITFLLCFILIEPFAFAAKTGQEVYSDGAAFTKDPTGGQTGQNGGAVGQNLSNANNLLQLIIKMQAAGGVENLLEVNGTNKSTVDASGGEAQDVKTLRSLMGPSNTPSRPPSDSLHEQGGKGDQKKAFCKDYIDPVITPNPEPLKYSECQAVVELDKRPVRDWRVSHGFTADQVDWPGNGVIKAKNKLNGLPQADILPSIGVGIPGATGGASCVTTNKTGPAQLTNGVCTKALVPETARCTVSVDPTVVVQTYCNANGGPYPITAKIRANIPNIRIPGSTHDAMESFGAGNFATDVAVTYSCGPMINGEAITIKVTLSTGSGSFDTIISPGVSKPWAQGKVRNWIVDNSCSCVFCAPCTHTPNWELWSVMYDGPSDTIYVNYDGQTSGSLPTPNFNGQFSSCAPGTTFVPASAPYTVYTSYIDANGYIAYMTDQFFAVPSYCTKPSEIVLMYPYTSAIKQAAAGACVAPYIDYQDYYLYPSGQPLCYIPAAGNCPAGFFQSFPPPVISGAGGTIATFKTYCTLQSAIDNLYPFTPAVHYLGSAGLHEVLVENVSDTCAPLQSQSLPSTAPKTISRAPLSFGCSTPSTLNTNTGMCDYTSIPAINIGSNKTCPSSYVLNGRWCDPLTIRTYPATWALTIYDCPQGGTLGQSSLGQSPGLCYLP